MEDKQLIFDKETMLSIYAKEFIEELKLLFQKYQYQFYEDVPGYFTIGKPEYLDNFHWKEIENHLRK